MAAIYLPENKLHPFVTQTQNEMHLKGKGSATGTMEIVLGKEKCRDECSTGSNNQVYRGAKTQNFPDSDKPKKQVFASHDIAKECVFNVLEL